MLLIPPLGDGSLSSLDKEILRGLKRLKQDVAVTDGTLSDLQARASCNDEKSACMKKIGETLGGQAPSACSLQRGKQREGAGDFSPL